jgi:predicted RNase H-like nuclease (RuvC/YqgF family)
MNSKNPTKKRGTDLLREQVRDLQQEIDELADAIEDDRADAEQVARTMQELTQVHIAIEDATEAVIDADADRWRVIDEARVAMYQAGQAIALEEDGQEATSPTPRGSWNAAISYSTAAAEYAEQAREVGDR